MTQNEVVARALDEITSMKILSRIEGDEEKVKAELLASLKEVVSKMLPENMRDSSVSLAKLDEMEKKLSSGYTSFGVNGNGTFKNQASRLCDDHRMHQV